MILYILIFGTFPNGSGQVQYHFEEDFFGAPSEAWTFVQWVNTDPNSMWFGNLGTNHTFTFDNEMVSSGTPNSSVVNTAILPDSTAYGAWSLDVLIPSDSIVNEIWNTRFYIATWRLKPADFLNEPNTDDWQAFKISTLGDNFRLEAHNSSPVRLLDISAPGLIFDTYQHYDLIRTSSTFFFYVDQELIIEVDFSSNIAPEINFFEIDTLQGSSIKFDNIKITTDYQGMCEELGCSEETEPDTEVTESDTEEPEPDTEESTIKWFQIGIGGAVVAVIFSVYGYYRFKKKDLAN